MRIVLAVALLPGCLDAATADAWQGVPLNHTVYHRFPLTDRALFYQTVGVDHDPEVQESGMQSGICTNYDGRAFPWCYDGHDGTDYLLEGGFDAMDAGSAEVVAAADGVVITVTEGNYDRCHVGEELVVTCDGHDIIANRVEIAHADGVISKYLHLMKDSVVVAVGDAVVCGDTLGWVGSSGNSSMPHLHFELESVSGRNIDPYAGAYSQEKSYWIDQGPAAGFPEADCPAP